MSLSPSSLLEFDTQGGETTCQGVHLGLELFKRLLLVDRHGKMVSLTPTGALRMSLQPSLQRETSELQSNLEELGTRQQ